MEPSLNRYIYSTALSCKAQRLLDKTGEKNCKSQRSSMFVMS